MSLLPFNNNDIISSVYIIVYPGVRGWIGFVRKDSKKNEYYADTFLEDFYQKKIIGEGKIIPSSLELEEVKVNLEKYIKKLKKIGFGLSYYSYDIEKSWEDFCKDKCPIKKDICSQFLCLSK